MPSLRELHEQVIDDPWRTTQGFSADMNAANQALLGMPTWSADGAAAILADWLRRPGNQPCLFGRLGASLDLLSYCVLGEEDLAKSDDEITAIIQASRTAWRHKAFDGKKSGFIVWAVSRKLTSAEPNEKLLAFASKLCSLYLLREDTPVDEVLLEDLCLEAPGAERATWRWDAGVNYFGACGDQRWWHDHRIPGGVAFSVNSVGHMVKSCRLAGAARAYEAALDVEPTSRVNVKLNDLQAALVMAMKTIDNAAPTCSGKATELAISPYEAGKCPFPLPDKLQERNPHQYIGYYHTDHTIPSVYFRPDVIRPSGVTPFVLDFTYLTTAGADNPAHQTMGRGVRIRDDGLAPHAASVAAARKLALNEPDLVPFDKCPAWAQELLSSRPGRGTV